jgi:tripartite-type tricarboxylate transporter receptor subunit TctC
LTDLLARSIGDRLGAALKQPVIIENKPGAGTLIGAEFVAEGSCRWLHAARWRPARR